LIKKWKLKLFEGNIVFLKWKDCEAVKFVSPANNRGFVLFRQCGKSLMYNKKNNGLNIELCGTPHFIKRSDENKFFIWHIWFRFVR
jgi:hypothetical protein